MSRRKPEEPEDPFSGLKAGTSPHEFGAASPWQGVAVDGLMGAVCAVTARGDAVLLGTTSDGGAMSVLILSRGAKRRFYESEIEKMDDLLSEITKWAEST